MKDLTKQELIAENGGVFVIVGSILAGIYLGGQYLESLGESDAARHCRETCNG